MTTFTEGCAIRYLRKNWPQLAAPYRRAQLDFIERQLGSWLPKLADSYAMDALEESGRHREADTRLTDKQAAELAVETVQAFLARLRATHGEVQALARRIESKELIKTIKTALALKTKRPGT